MTTPTSPPKRAASEVYEFLRRRATPTRPSMPVPRSTRLAGSGVANGTRVFVIFAFALLVPISVPRPTNADVCVWFVFVVSENVPRGVELFGSPAMVLAPFHVKIQFVRPSWFGVTVP